MHSFCNLILQNFFYMFRTMNVLHQEVSGPDDGPSWPETCKRIFVKLNCNKSAFSWF